MPLDCGGGATGSQHGFEGLLETFTGDEKLDANQRRLAYAKLMPRSMWFRSGSGGGAFLIAPNNPAFAVRLAAPSLAANVVFTFPATTGGAVINAGGSTDNAIARFDSTTGQIIQDSAWIIDDTPFALHPAANDAGGLGTATYQVSDLFLADGAVINYNGDVTLTHSTDALTIAGGIPIMPTSTTSFASLRIPHGTAPTSPVNGDVWTTTTSVTARVNSVSVNLMPLTTKGDVYTYSTVNTRLGVGADGTLLMASAAAGTGLAWATTLTGTYTFNNPILLAHAAMPSTSPSNGFMQLVGTPTGLRTSSTSSAGVTVKCCFPCKHTQGIDPFLWLQMEETGSDAQDSSGNALHFTASTAAIGNDTGKVTHDGPGAGARDLELSSGHYFSRAYSTDWEFSTGAFMIAVWAKPESNADDNYVMSKAAGGGTAWSLRADNSGAWRFAYGGQTTPGHASVAVTVGSFQLVMGWFDPSTGKIHCQVDDGTVQEASGASHTDGSATIYVGQDGTDDNYFDGLLDEVYLAKAVPDAATRAGIYNGGAGTNDPGCKKLQSQDVTDSPGTQGQYASVPTTPTSPLSPSNPASNGYVRSRWQSLFGD